MSVNAEDGVSFLSRLRPVAVGIDAEVMSNHMIFVIDLSETDLKDSNDFVYYICKNIFDKYCESESYLSTDWPNGQRLPDDYESQSSESLQESIDDFNRSVQCSQRSLRDVKLSDDSESGNSSDDSIDNPLNEIKSIVILIDGNNGFNLRHLSKVISNKGQLKRMSFIRAIDGTQLLAALTNDIAVNLALNPDLKLVVIYANTSVFYRKIADQVISQLSSLAVSVHFLLMFDKLNESQRNEILNKPLFDILSIKSIEENLIEIKSNRNNKIFIRDITKKSFT